LGDRIVTIKKRIDDTAGKICEAILPIGHEYYIGNGKDIAICTLSSIDLLEAISKSIIMAKIAIAGRLLSENKGIDAMIKFTLEHQSLSRIIVCGQEVKGHRAGQALLSLYKNGIDRNGRIIGAISPYPIIKSSDSEVNAFRKQIVISNIVGTESLDKIKALVA
jgi:tetrahydromethanopterin S-methyltransferase subunit A